MKSRSIKLVTLLDRSPNYLFDLWLNHHVKYFDIGDILITLNIIEPEIIQSQLKSRYNLDSYIATNINDISNDVITIYKDPTSNVTSYQQLIDHSRNISNKIQHVVLDSGYDIMIWLDMDELLYHKKLNDVLQNFEQEIIRPIGIEIIQNDEESNYDTNKKLKDQRSYIRYYNSKNKPIITRKKVTWDAGRHFCELMLHGDITKSKDCYPDLYLIHLDKIDIEKLKELRLQNEIIYNNIPQLNFDNWIIECKSELLNGEWLINQLCI